MAQSPSSPTKIFARIESLKKWQMEQQNKLLQQQSQQSNFLLNEKKRMYEALQEQPLNETDECNTLQQNKQVIANDNYFSSEYSDEDISVSFNHNEMKRKDLDEVPIKSPMQDFTSLLEEKLKENNTAILNEHIKPRRNFLKRGTGLSRFRMTLKDLAHNKPKPKMTFTKKRITSNKQQLKIRHESCVENNVKDNERVSRNNKNKTKAVSFSDEPKIEPLSLNSDLNFESSETRYPEHKISWTTAAENNPTDYHTLIAELIHARQRNPSLFDSPLNKSHENQLFGHDPPDELKLFEILEQKASNSSFCSTSSLATKFIKQPIKLTPKKKLNFALLANEIPEEKIIEKITSTPIASSHDEHESESEDETKEHTTDSESTSSDTNSSVNSDDVSDMHTIIPTKYQKKKKILRKDSATNTDQPVINSEILKTKLEELEKELATFRLENARINRLKSQLEIDTRNFEKQKRLLEKEVEEQKKQIKLELTEERAKLIKDRSVYDRYIREIKEGKSMRQKEREELNALKSRLTSTEEEMKLKESKWGATQARIRSQLKQLEKENCSLRAENNELRIKNGKLEATNKQLLNRRPSETKVLHEINKNLSKLTQETLEKQITQKKTTKNSERPKRRTRTPSPKQIENKENSRQSLNSTSESKSSSDRSFESVEREYEKLFGQNCTQDDENIKLPAAEASSVDISGRREETVLEDGSIRITYPNGNIKTISSNGDMIVMQYHNGDVKETRKESGTIRYLYSDAKTWHTTFPDGTEVLEFYNGQVEKRLPNGSSEILFPNGCRRCSSPSGMEEVTFPDGTTLITRSSGEKILSLPNGQKEVHTKDHKRREYPDGTVKLLYPDGVQETRYANGRIRLKDKQGNLIMDSATV